MRRRRAFAPEACVVIEKPPGNVPGGRLVLIVGRAKPPQRPDGRAKRAGRPDSAGDGADGFLPLHIGRFGDINRVAIADQEIARLEHAGRLRQVQHIDKALIARSGRCGPERSWQFLPVRCGTQRRRSDRQARCSDRRQWQSPQSPTGFGFRTARGFACRWPPERRMRGCHVRPRSDHRRAGRCRGRGWRKDPAARLCRFCRHASRARWPRRVQWRHRRHLASIVASVRVGRSIG